MVVTRNERRKEESRSKLIDAARRVMAEKGVRAMTIRDITQAADVGSGSFYNYFDSKEAVVNEIVDELMLEFANMTDITLESIEDPAEKVACAFSGFVQMVRANPLLMQLILSIEVMDSRVGEEARGRMVRDLRLGVEQGRFRLGDLELTSHMALGAMVGHFRIHHQEPHSAGEVRDVVQGLMQMLGLPSEEAAILAAQFTPEPAGANSN